MQNTPFLPYRPFPGPKVTKTRFSTLLALFHLFGVNFDKKRPFLSSFSFSRHLDSKLTKNANFCHLGTLALKFCKTCLFCCARHLWAQSLQKCALLSTMPVLCLNAKKTHLFPLYWPLGEKLLSWSLSWSKTTSCLMLLEIGPWMAPGRTELIWCLCGYLCAQLRHPVTLILLSGSCLVISRKCRPLPSKK